MIKNKIFKKLGISISILFTLLIIYLIPKNNYKQEIEYVSDTGNSTIVYLLNDSSLLSKTYITTYSKDPVKLAKEILESMINQNNLPNGFKSVMNTNTNILDISIDKDILKIDFDDSILEVSKKYEIKLIESLTYTLTSIKGINGIIIYKNGSLITKLPLTNYVLPSTLTKELGINKEVNITNYNNVEKVTVYYIGKNKDYYYIPVTKYVNDSRDKISIIIDELASNNTYNTNLMSFLNSNSKLLDVSIEEDTMYLTFNEYIFNDFMSKEILEEVIETISLSVKDNYDVDKLVFKYENKEILKNDLKSIE